MAALDSDGDGFSNGTELGDPSGSGTPTPGAMVTNPGDPASHPPPAASAPTITVQPTSQTVMVGTNVRLNVVATGTAPLMYQWKKDGNNIPTGTNPTLALDNVTTGDSGTYVAVVSNAGGTATSSPATLTVTAPPPPTITIALTSPINGATYAQPANFSLVANVSPAASITRVDFLQGSTVLGSLTTAPYSFSVVNLVAGTYTYTARATATGGATTTSAAVTITVTPPTPPPPTGPAVVTVVATDPNAAEVGLDPGTFRISRTGATTSSLTVYYQLGGTAVNGQDYQMLPSSTTIAAGSSSADLTVTPIADVDTPTEVSDTVILQLTGPPTGQPGYAVGSPSTAVVTIAEPPVTGGGGGANQPPTVSILRPADGASFSAPAYVVLTAQASDPDGTVASVEFFSGSTKLGDGQLVEGSDSEHASSDSAEASDSEGGSSSGGVYVFVWRRVTAGSYTLTAKATDNQGASTVSSPVHITVRGRRSTESETETSSSTSRD